MRAPALAVGDGALGFWGALRDDPRVLGWPAGRGNRQGPHMGESRTLDRRAHLGGSHDRRAEALKRVDMSVAADAKLDGKYPIPPAAEWAPPADWDDETIADAAAAPDFGTSKALRRPALVDLDQVSHPQEGGAHLDEIARRLICTAGAIEHARRRAGRTTS